MTQQQRQNLIIQEIHRNGFVNITELVSRFQVTPQTIRRDLNYLSKTQNIRRYHGGASLVSSTKNLPYKTRKVLNVQEKQKIAAQLVKAIPNGSSVFIGVGTTMEIIAEALLFHENLRVVTNNLHVANRLVRKKDFSVTIASGQLRSPDGSIIGEAAKTFMNQFYVEYGVIGASGIHTDGTLLEFDFAEVKTTHSILSNANKVLLAIDDFKFGRQAMVRLGHISQINHLFTNCLPSPNLLGVINQHRVKVSIVN